MILYHGSNTIVKNVNLELCRPYKDFGKGFYCTTLLSQANLMASRVSERYGENPVINIYEFDEKIFSSNNVTIKNFHSISEDWALFVMNNRSRKQFNPYFDNNKDNKYDLVIGPIADDDLTLLFRNYINGWISLDKLTKNMEYKKFTNQYSFHSEIALNFLKFMNYIME